MTDIVIKAENLGKKYTIGHQAADGRYVALRDVLVNNARSLWRLPPTWCAASPLSWATRLRRSGHSRT